MKSDVLKDKILHPTMDLEFYFRGKFGSICPFAFDDISVTYDGVTKDYDNIDDVMNDKFFDGKSLSEVSDDLEF